MLEWFAEQAGAVLVGARRRQALRLSAMTDGLTGLLNYRAFQSQLQHEIARVGRTGQPLSLLVIDADGLKTINDRFGHLVGDEVIRTIGRTIQENSRAADTPARWGGEEFLLLLPDTALEPARTVGERLRKKIAALRVEPVAQITVSMGGGCYPLQADSAGELIEVADRALYEAKQRGGNCLVLARTERVSVAV
jgi:diguanylate cyclase (GGDEF)-like protein